MNYETHEFEQGSEEWDSHRGFCHNASELSAAAGGSKNTTRSFLIECLATGREKEFSDFVIERVIKPGHVFESLARPLAEELIGEELYPSVLSVACPGLSRRLGASLDGKTMDDSTNWEHKRLNAELSASLDQGIIPTMYHWQMEQGMMINGAKRCLFSASDWDDNNDLIDIKHCWYESNPELRAKIVPIWKQVEEDVANYKHVEVIPAAVAAPIKDLPALSVQIVGHVAASNLAEWKSVVTDRIQSINTNLQSDQDFADAGKMVTFLDDGEKKIDLVKAQAQSQAVEIDEIFRALDDIKATMRAKRLELNKLVEKRKIDIRAESMQAGKQELAEHMAALNKRLGRVLMPPVNVDFAEAMKGKKTVSSLRGAVADTLANAKISANETADRIQANLATIDEHKEYAFLFNDQSALVMKAPDDLANVIKLRITEHAAEQQRKLDAAREQIRAQEQAKAQREAAAKADAERKEQERIAAEAKAKADREAAEKAAIEKPVETIALGTGLMPITQTVDPIQRQEPVRKAGEVVTVPPQDYGRQISGLVSQMTSNEQKLVLHFCERTLTQRQEAA